MENQWKWDENGDERWKKAVVVELNWRFRVSAFRSERKKRMNRSSRRWRRTECLKTKMSFLLYRKVAVESGMTKLPFTSNWRRLVIGVNMEWYSSIFRGLLIIILYYVRNLVISVYNDFRIWICFYYLKSCFL